MEKIGSKMGHLRLNTKKINIFLEMDDEKHEYEESLKEAIKLLKRELKEAREFAD